MLKTSRALVVVLFALVGAPAMAASQGGSGFDPNHLFFGAGLSLNDVSGSDKGLGYQFFGGYEFGELAQNIKFDAEIGYMDTGDMDFPVGSARAKGLWANGVGRFVLNPQWELLLRAGLDFGDDDGLMVGAGAGLNLNKQSTLRFEVVERDHVSSIEVNFVYRP